MAARWLIAALCFAKVLAVLGDCSGFLKCSECTGDCKWCEAVVSVKAPADVDATLTPIPAAAVCAATCDDVSFGTLDTMMKFTYGDDDAGTVDISATTPTACATEDDVPNESSTYADCAACKGASKVWCPLSYAGEGFDTREGGVCIPEGPCAVELGLEGLTMGDEVEECPADSTVAPTAAPGAAAVVPHGGKLLLAALAASVTGVLL